ncbi:beta-N-acetylhexosaminidase [Aureimonas pseudogalii]|uniref:beta-N-acetylhexosaminidase n=1 Tax=Aureimonas pseudogalii TaxID=1744844 RepID=A0A7W6H5V5_9HYPH|nr:beta-N-acetylhexosaminidase [Aureimonas pseudogalii]MBB3999125.1 beta-N-acetylhexosaminidase [Aureimonas pseudogalii]
MPKAWIAGCSGLALTADERAFFADERPWGFILFGRNVSEPAQLRDLVAELTEAGARDTVPILVDQEGGRVQRLRPPLAPRYPPSMTVGRVHERDGEEAGLRAAWLQGRLLGHDLRDGYGINVDCLPCLDVAFPGTHSVIGDRAYSNDPAVVAALGRAAADGLMASGVLPVMKHLPGHGRTDADSHLELPRVRATRAELEAVDFPPFRALRDLPAGMTAHLLFEALDALRPTTLSPSTIGEIIRGELGFDGLLMSDDMSMKALDGDMGDLTAAAISAGCDLALHCNGDMAEMAKVAASVPELTGRAAERAERALDVIRRGATPGSIDEERREFEGLLALVA